MAKPVNESKAVIDALWKLRDASEKELKASIMRAIVFFLYTDELEMSNEELREVASNLSWIYHFLDEIEGKSIPRPGTEEHYENPPSHTEE